MVGCECLCEHNSPSEYSCWHLALYSLPVLADTTPTNFSGSGRHSADGMIKSQMFYILSSDTEMGHE